MVVDDEKLGEAVRPSYQRLEQDDDEQGTGTQRPGQVSKYSALQPCKQRHQQTPDIVGFMSISRKTCSLEYHEHLHMLHFRTTFYF